MGQNKKIDNRLQLELIELLSSYPPLSMREGRDAWLLNLPDSVRQLISRRSEYGRYDLAFIIDSIQSLRLEDGRWPLLILIDVVLEEMEGLATGSALQALRQRLENLYTQSPQVLDDTKSSEPSDLWSTGLGQPPTGPLRTISDILLVPTQEPGPSAQQASLHALSLYDGSLRWRQSFDHMLVSGLAVTTGDIILITTSSTDLQRGEGALLAIDTAGEVHWRWSPGVQRVSAPTVTRDIACITTNGRTLNCLDPGTGEERLRIELAVGASVAAPLLADNVVYVPCRGPHLVAVGMDGRSRWQFEAEASPEAWLDKMPVVVGERVFAVLSTGTVLALHTDDGSLVWRIDIGPKGKPLSPPTTDEQQLYVGTHDGLHAISLAEGREVWSFPTSRRITGAPVVEGGVVYVTCHDQHLYALDCTTGQELWRYKAKRRIEVAPVVTTGGRPSTPCVLIADHGGMLVAVARPLSAEEHETAGHWVEAASAYTRLGQLVRGAQLLENHGEPLRAAELWAVAGEREHAVEMYEAAGAWQEAAEIWDSLGQPLKKAEMLERHARSLEEAACGDAECAAAWEAAAQAWEAEGEAERAAACQQAVGRCMHQPAIALDVRHEGLVLGAWSHLQFTVRNAGYGPARNLVIHAEGEQFEGQVTQTRRIVTLLAGHSQAEWLDVRPRQYGDSVPLRLRVEYQDPAGEMRYCERTIYMAVARSEATRRGGETVNVFVSGGGAARTGGVAVGGDVQGDAAAGRPDHLPLEEGEPAAGTGTGWNTAVVRDLLSSAFSDEELVTFCFDYFPAVYEDLGSGMGKGQKVQRLLDYCLHRGQMEELLARLRACSPAWYARFSARLGEIGKYEIIEELGRGGFATVYKARDVTLDRVVALKVLHPHWAEDRQFVDRFRQEARVAARLRHPHIVTVYEAGEADGQLYIVMEYLPGRTLQALLEAEGALPLERALPILEQVAEALDHAHAQGVVHRDIRPGNVMVEQAAEGVRATLTDFGLVKALAAGNAVTPQGTLLGSPEYMAPEQADPERAGEVGPAADRYALGVVAYQMLTGRVPFPGNAPATLYAHEHKPVPPPRSLRPDLPGSVEKALLKMLAKNPADRYPSAGAFVAELQVLVESVVQAERPSAEFAPWFLSLSCPSRVVDVGRTVQAVVKLSPHSHSTEEIVVPDSGEPIVLQLDAAGLSLLSERIQSFVLPENKSKELYREIKCVALRPGNFRLTATAHDPGTEVNRSIHVAVSVRRSRSQKLPELPSPIGPRPGRQPDMTVRVYVSPLDKAGLCYRLSYVAFSPLSRLRLPGVPIGSMDIPAVRLAQTRAELAQIASTMSSASPASIQARLSALGRRLYQRFFPREARELYQEMVNANIRSWLILCEAEPWIPWELVKPFDTSGEDDFLGGHFAITRFVEGQGTPYQYEFPLGLVSLTLDERLRQHYQPSEWSDLFTPGILPRLRSPLMQEYADGYISAMRYDSPVWGLHFVGVPDSLARSSGTLTSYRVRQTLPQQTLSEESVQEATLDFWSKRPLVTFGMVTLAGRSALTEMEQKWVPTFAKAGIASFVGNLWSTDPQADRLFWSTFYQAIWARKSLGEAALAARQRVREALPDSMDWLAYFAVGDPMARGHVPRPSERYAALECTSHNLEQPLYAGQSYDFHASLSLVPPVTYHGRRYRTEPTAIQEPHLMIFAPEFDVIPDKWVSLTKRGAQFAQSFQIRPRRPGRYDLFVRFLDGEELLQTIDFTVEVEGGRQ